MQIRRIFPAYLFFSLSGALAAHAASSDWHHVEGASIRLVTSASEGDGDRLLGALQIRLEPGWKTYWRDPGSSGVPPTLDVTLGGKPASMEIAFPEPQRFDDEYAPWAGYKHTVSLALSIELPEGTDAEDPLEARAFLGVCETICIPVQATLKLAPGSSSNNSEDEMVVAAAFAALPSPAGLDMFAKSVRIDNDALTIAAVVPEGTDVLDIFVAGNDKLVLGTPVRSDGETVEFTVPLHGKPSPRTELAYTLATSAGAVSGKLIIP